MTCSNKCPDCDCAPTAESKPEAFIAFKVDDMEPILVIDREGMTYKGQRINDIGLAYAAFMQTMELMQQAVVLKKLNLNSADSK